MSKNSKAKRVRGHADIAVRLFMIAARFCGDPNSRTAISGVRIEKHPNKGVVLVGTDGHRMIIIHDVHGRCSHPFTMDAKSGLKAARAMDKTTATEETRWRVTAGPVRKGWKRVRTTDAEYPVWWRIPIAVGNTRGGAVHTINPKYLIDFARIAAELEPRGKSLVIVPGKQTSDPILIRFPHAPHVCAVLMPMMGDDGKHLPSFIAPILTRKK